MDAQKNPNQATEMPQVCCASRMQGKAVINDIIHRLRRRADNLQTLLDMLPSNPTPQQDEALWQVACGMERV